MRKLRLCMWACIWSFLMTGCSALWNGGQLLLEAESTKVYVEMNEEAAQEAVTQESVEEDLQQDMADSMQSMEEVIEQTTDTGEEKEVMGATVHTGTDVSEEGVPEQEGVPELQEDYSYFDDALFIGDSRTVGLREYGLFENSDFFATPGLSIYAIPRTKVTVHDLEDVMLEDLLAQKDYGKIYLMLGMNELGYDFEQTVERYRTFVEDLQAKEPQAKLYLCANMHVTVVRTEHDDIFNNSNINKMNEEICKLAEEKELSYLDINIVFDDENGNLNEEYTSDDSHILGKYYEDWCKWLAENISE